MPALECHFHTVAGPQAYSFTENSFQHRCFPVNVAKESFYMTSNMLMLNNVQNKCKFPGIYISFMKIFEIVLILFSSYKTSLLLSLFPLMFNSFLIYTHCVKSVRIRSFSGPYSIRMREKTDKKNSKYGHFSRSDR